MFLYLFFIFDIQLQRVPALRKFWGLKDMLQKNMCFYYLLFYSI
jgi:hypothetical protein